MKSPLVVTVLMAAALSCTAPRPDQDGDPAPGAAAASCVSQLPAEQQAAVVESWIGGAIPPEVSGSEVCDFQDFAWQSFLALTDYREGAYAFTRWGGSDALFPADGVPPPYPGASAAGKFATGQIAGKHGSNATRLADPPVVDPDAAIQQANALVPLVDQDGRWVQYSVSANAPEYEFVRGLGLYASACYDSWGGSSTGAVKYDPGAKIVTVECGAQTCECAPEGLFPSPLPAVPTGSMELKAAWRVLETCALPDSPTPCTPDDAAEYVTVQSVARPYSPTVAQAEVLLGLVGLHILHKTLDHPDWVWMTFEHVDNVPDCPGEPGDWLFYGDGENVNMFCTSCPIPLDEWTESAAAAARAQAAKGQAVLSADGSELICSANPGAFNLARPPFYNPGTGEGQCAADPIVTEVCRSYPIEASVRELNAIVAPVLAAEAPALANYQLVGVLWLDSWCGENPDCQEVGSLDLTNTTMETYDQNLNCLVCHDKNQFNPNPYALKPYAAGIADRSFLFHRIAQATLPGGTRCEAPAPSYSCDPPGEPLAAGGG